MECHSWDHSAGWSPTNSLAVQWSDGELRYYKADCFSGQWDLAIVVPQAGWRFSRCWSKGAVFQVLGAGVPEETFDSTICHEFFKRRPKIWKERLDRFMQICKTVSKRQICQCTRGSIEEKEEKKKQMLRFAQQDFFHYYVAQDQSTEWWNFRELFG